MRLVSGCAFCCAGFGAKVEELAAGVTVELRVDTMMRISKYVDNKKGKCSRGYICLFEKRCHITIYIK